MPHLAYDSDRGKPMNDENRMPTPKRTFMEPVISSPVDVVRSNPAAGVLFAIAGSGGAGADGGTGPFPDPGPPNLD